MNDCGQCKECKCNNKTEELPLIPGSEYVMMFVLFIIVCGFFYMGYSVFN